MTSAKGASCNLISVKQKVYIATRPIIHLTSEKPEDSARLDVLP